MYGNEVQPAQNEPQEFIMLNLSPKGLPKKWDNNFDWTGLYFDDSNWSNG